MEEILASIRRIIADEDGIAPGRRDTTDRHARPVAEQRHESIAPAPAAAPEEPELGFEEEGQVEASEFREFYAEEVTAHSPEEHSAYTSETGDPDVGYRLEEEPDDSAFGQDRFVERTRAFREEETPAPLVSPDAAASIAAQFQTLAASMLINDSGLLHEYARELLRPMLKAWLDDNLPVLVERLVRAEIERVARGGRR